MARIFAYIAHKGGVADDSAAELAAAAKKIDAAAAPTAVVTGWGTELDSVCNALRGSYTEVWKIANEVSGLSECGSGAESAGKSSAGRKHCAGCARAFRNRSGAGSLYQAECCFCLRRVGDRRGRRRPAQSRPSGIWRTGERSCPCDISSGAVITIRPGAFKPLEALRSAGSVIDKSADVGALTARGAIWRRWSPSPVMSISPSTAFWFPSVAASRKRTTSRWRRNSPRQWARR